MSEDTKKLAAPDRAAVAGRQDYEVEHFANMHGISTEQARALIRQYGNHRRELEAALAALKKSAEVASLAALSSEA